MIVGRRIGMRRAERRLVSQTSAAASNDPASASGMECIVGTSLAGN